MKRKRARKKDKNMKRDLELCKIAVIPYPISVERELYRKQHPTFYQPPTFLGRKKCPLLDRIHRRPVKNLMAGGSIDSKLPHTTIHLNQDSQVDRSFITFFPC